MEYKLEFERIIYDSLSPPSPQPKRGEERKKTMIIIKGWKKFILFSSMLSPSVLRCTRDQEFKSLNSIPPPPKKKEKKKGKSVYMP